MAKQAYLAGVLFSLVFLLRAGCNKVEVTNLQERVTLKPTPSQEVQKQEPIQKPIVDESARVVIKRDKIDSFKTQLPEPCEFDKIDALNFSTNKENNRAIYKNLAKGLEVSIPYNSEWGSPKYRLNPFDEEKNGIAFGTINVRGEGCGAWVVTQRLTFLPAESKEATLKRLQKESAAEKFPYSIDTLTIGDKEVIEYNKDGMCAGGGTIIIGKKYNYELSDTCGSNTREDIIKSMRFIE